MKIVGAVAVVVGLLVGLSPSAAADDYTDADTKFIAAVSPEIGRNQFVDKTLIDQLIADGHKVCNLMDAGQYDVIDHYIRSKYGTHAGYPMYVFAYAASEAYCPWHTKGLAAGGV
jgi:hypothetical protein